MENVGIFDAKTNLTKLINRVENGEKICITKRGKKVAYLTPINDYQCKDIIKELNRLKKVSPLGSVDDILELKERGRK